ncbi:MAG: hypothetical protein Kow00127_20650 [Bacteroidales bacterium]
MKQRFLILFLFLFIAGFSVMQAQQDTSYELQLKAGDINLAEGISNDLLSPSAGEVVDGYYYRIVQFYAIPFQNERMAMEATGLTFLEYLPNYAYLVAVPEDFNWSPDLLQKVRAMEAIIPLFKQDPLILDKNYPEYALRADNKIALMVTYYENLDQSLLLDQLRDVAATIIETEPISSIMILKVPLSEVETIVSLPAVRFVEPLYPPSEPENYTGKTLHRSNVLDSDYESGRHYDGTGVNIMLQDDGIIGPHIDYEGRILAQLLTNNSGDHGDHCAGIIFGAGNIDPTLAGQAPGASMYVYQAAPLYPGFSDIPNAYTNNDVRISSTSYSNGCNAGYTSLARTMDLQIRNYPSLMHVFSAGNSGTENCGYGAGAGWGNVTGGHKIGKNVIAVANLNETDGLAGSSSRGPAHDGRIKPDISAKGTSVNSTTNPNSYTVKSGTSMACPAVAGNLAQLYHAYKELHSGEEPKGGLMKAIILNTADDLLNVGPDYKTGWGRINSRRAVELLEDERYLTDEISQGETNTHTINVPSGVAELKVMVYWTDKEASVSTNHALVNDLNMTVTDPSNQENLPWVLNPYPHPDSLNKPAVKGIDDLNNMEQVSIVNPTAGNYTVNVDGFTVPYGPQEYYVVWEYVKTEVKLTYPLGGEGFKPSENILVRWDAWDTEEPFTLEYSVDNGTNWTVANDNISPTARHYYLTLPSTLTGHALVRISNSGSSSTSEAPFSIMQVPTGLEVDRACPESVLLRWDPVTDAESYNVYMLGEKYMELVGTTNADSLEVDGLTYEETYWFSVSANGPDGAQSRRAVAIEKEPGVWNCVFGKDVALTDIISPPMGVLFNCQDLTDLPVQVEIANTGMDPMSGITVYYEFEGGSVVSEPFGGTLQPGEKQIFVFSSSISMPSNGIYDMAAWIEVSGDENAANNQIEGVSKVKTAQSGPVNELITFDEYNTCSIDPDCGDISCYLDNQWYNLQNNLNDDIDWRVLNGITPTPNTGPIGDHTTGTAEGRFLYLEASGECYEKKAIFHSPCFDLSGLTNPGVLFWFSLNGADMGTLHLDVVSDGVLYKDVMDPISGNWGNQWYEGHAYLDQFAGKQISLRFRGYTGDGEYSDMAIDDITITEVSATGSLPADREVRIFPNPSEGLYTVELSGKWNEDLTITVSDLTGRQINRLNYEKTDLPERLALDLTGYPEGIYLLTVSSEQGTTTRKLLRK